MAALRMQESCSGAASPYTNTCPAAHTLPHPRSHAPRPPALTVRPLIVVAVLHLGALGGKPVQAVGQVQWHVCRGRGGREVSGEGVCRLCPPHTRQSGPSHPDPPPPPPLRGQAPCPTWRRVFVDGQRCRGVLNEEVRNSHIKVGQLGQLNYSSAKVAIALWPKVMVGEFLLRGIRNIRVVGIAPGYTETGLLAQMNQEALKAILQDVHLGRLVHPEEIADMIGYCVKNAALNATTIEITGGLCYPKGIAK